MSSRPTRPRRAAQRLPRLAKARMKARRIRSVRESRWIARRLRTSPACERRHPVSRSDARETSIAGGKARSKLAHGLPIDGGKSA